MSLIHYVKPLIAVSAAGLLIAGCSSGDMAAMPGMSPGSSAMPSASTQLSMKDVDFLQIMAARHQQAVDLARMAASKSQNRDVLDLASVIETSESSDIDRINALLGRPPMSPREDRNPMPDMTDAPHRIDGRLSQEQIDALAERSGPDFDRAFVQTMIDHHSGCADMAESDLKDGSNRRAKELAAEIAFDFRAEIAQMREILAQL